MDAELAESFHVYKGAGVLTSLLLIAGAQLLVPNRLSLGAVMRNWQVNAPLAVIDTAALTLLCGACVCTWAVTVRANGIGLFEAAALPYWSQVPTTVVVLDLVAYLWHRANHRWALLWRFHAVHHSDVHFEASTAFRFHPGELLISVGVRLAVVTVTGLPVLGLITFEVLYGFCNLLVHSDIRIGRGLEHRLGWLVVTPSLHRLHHSEQPNLHNSNFGTIFSIWDRLWRTFIDGHADTAVTLGLPGQDGRALGLGEALRRPLRRSVR
jgi:sterol desaturase/sphingolipid hydroxylase (fatty acid hydroxylase superfamily)